MSGAKFVFCEGGDDLAVISGVAKSIHLAELAVEEFSGKDRLRNFLASAKMRPEFAQNKVATLAIVRDADDDAQAAFQSVCESLRGNGFPFPAQNGGVVEAGGMKVGVYVVGPKQDGTGMIEDLCLESVSDQPGFGCVADYFQCVSATSNRTGFSAKAKVRVWMASHPDPTLYVGKAAERGHWPWQHPAFNDLKEFLRKL